MRHVKGRRNFWNISVKQARKGRAPLPLALGCHLSPAPRRVTKLFFPATPFACPAVDPLSLSLSLAPLSATLAVSFQLSPQS